MVRIEMTGMPSSCPTSIGKLNIPSAMIQVTDCPVTEFNWPEHSISLNSGFVTNLKESNNSMNRSPALGWSAGSPSEMVLNWNPGKEAKRSRILEWRTRRSWLKSVLRKVMLSPASERSSANLSVELTGPSAGSGKMITWGTCDPCSIVSSSIDLYSAKFCVCVCSLACGCKTTKR